ncbi:hypothetical protein ASG48_17385 [Aurantimonas sp. Leaf443]|nr:hypothetical protein ASG48_17385 [Aurantimonas sp. Leaf443]
MARLGDPRAVLAVALAGLGAGLLLFALGRDEPARLVLTATVVPPAALVARDIVRALKGGRLGVDAIALAAMLASVLLGEPLAGAVVALMYSGGQVLEDFAERTARRDLRLLVDRAPTSAQRITAGGVSVVPVGEVRVGDRLLVPAGAVIPVDGIVRAPARLDESTVTGEPLPVLRPAGAPVRSGSLNVGAMVEMEARARADDSTYAGIVAMVGEAQAARAPFLRAADRFSLWLLPGTLAVAGGAWLASGEAQRALAVLVVATPCPLILAAPVAFVSGIARAARRNILVRGGATLERLAEVRTVFFDKTGTLTRGGASLTGIEARAPHSGDEILTLLASLEQGSTHVVAKAIVAVAAERGLALSTPSKVRETPGEGLEGRVAGRTVLAGSVPFVFAALARPRPARETRAERDITVAVAVDGAFAGLVRLGDRPRPEAGAVTAALRAFGIGRIALLTGDEAAAAEPLRGPLGLDEIGAGLTPAEKLAAIHRGRASGPVAMVGDGINDAPALAAADVGIAMGARGLNASSQTADVVILVEDLGRVPEAFAIARRTRRIALQSMGAGLALSALAMAAAAFGLLAPVPGALVQEAIDVAVVLNALRALGGRS